MHTLDSLDHRILVVSPAGRDATRARRILRSASLSTYDCRDLEQLCDELPLGAGVALIAEEALGPESTRRLGALLAAQPPWSDVPVIIVAGARTVADKGGELAASLAPLGNVTVLARPIHTMALVSSVRGALRARIRQYELRDLLHSREDELRARDQLLAMLGHELRNPLAAITLASEAMSRSGIVSRDLGTIARQASHLSLLVDDLLDVTRMTSDKVSLRSAPLVFSDLVKRTVKSVCGDSPTHELVLTLGKTALVVDGDAMRLEQVITNILSNSLKYTPEGGRIEVSLRRERSDAVLTVQDSGIGIESALLPHVFDLFVQGDRSLDRARGGMGIGLSLVQRLVELHGGSVSAESEGPGRGARVIVRIPAKRIRRPRQREFAFRPMAPAPRRIVVVEDNEDAREALVAGLEEAGHEVASAADGPSGLSLLLEMRPDVAILDIGLPGLDGYGVVRHARAALGPEPLFIALTGYGQPEDRIRAIDAGFDLHQTKPLELAQLQNFLVQARKTAV